MTPETRPQECAHEYAICKGMYPNVPSKIATPLNSEHIMSKNSIYTLEGLDDFYLTLRKLFLMGENLSICNLKHYEETATWTPDWNCAAIIPNYTLST